MKRLEFGKRIRRMRRERDKTQEELAAALSVSIQSVSRWETGAAYPDIELLPVIAGYFGITVDALLDASRIQAERRKEEYEDAIKGISDHKKRLEIRKRQCAEFPNNWEYVSDVCYEMQFLPEYLEEMRVIVQNAMERCTEPLWRENIMFWYLKAEAEEEEKILDFIDRWGSHYSLHRGDLLLMRYRACGDKEKAIPIEQYNRLRHLKAVFDFDCNLDAEDKTKIADYRAVLEFIRRITGAEDEEVPDMWFSTKILALLRLSNALLLAGEREEGYEVLSRAARLYENFFSLPDGTVLTYQTATLDRLSARTKKGIYYVVDERSGMERPRSIKMELNFINPIAPTNKRTGKWISDMDGFTQDIVFSDLSYDIVNEPTWPGFASVRNEPKYKKCLGIFNIS